MQQESSCSAMSLEAGESLRGTAVADTSLWVVVESERAWGTKGLEDSGLPEAVVRQLKTLSKSHDRVRVQLIRRPERDDGACTVFLANSAPEAPSLLRRTFANIEELSSVDFDAWARGALPIGFLPVHTPLYLVCTHGKRDKCCAQLGLPVFAALFEQAGEAVWQTTHLGGHRFAATLLVLPSGICYGRVEAREAAELTEAHARNELFSLSRLRGRCAYPSAAQAAEELLREQLGELRLDALTLLSCIAEHDGERVRFRHLPSEREHEVWVVREKLPAFPQSCGASPKAGEGLIALRLSGR